MIKRPLCLAAVLFLGIQIIFTGGTRKAEAESSSLLEKSIRDGESVFAEGTVVRREERPTYQMLYLTDVQVRHEEQLIYESKILVYFKQYETQKSNVKHSETISIGNKVQFAGELSFFEPASNHGNFDRRFYYRKQGINACIWSEGAEVTDPSVRIVEEKLTRLKGRWKSLLIKALGKEYGNTLSAILLGDKSELEEGAKELYQASGIGHIMAISGLHMSFLGSGLYHLLRRTGLSFLPAGGIGILALILYTMMIGGGVSSQRALVMFIVRVGADMCGRDYDLPTSLAIAAAVIVFRQPLYLWDAGFLLSFGALTGLAVVTPVLEECNLMPRMLRASVAVQLVLLPILLYFYFEIPVYSMLLNLLVIPLMSVLLGAGLIGSVVSVFWTGGGMFVLQICRLILWGYEKSAQLTLGVPFGRVVTGQPKKWMCIVYYVILFGGCVILMWYREKNRYRDKKRSNAKALWKNGAVVLYVVLFCLSCKWNYRGNGKLIVTAVDVGQGDCLYIRTPSGRHYLIDGGSTSEAKVGKYRIEPFLKSQGVGKLDYVFVSHGDADHINGIEELLADQKTGIQIDTLVLPPKQVLEEHLLKLATLAETGGTRAAAMECGGQITDGEMSLSCLAPSQEYAGEIGNASSMVLELDYKAFEMLFTGDLEDEGEQQLLESGQLQDTDVLKAGHHGSGNSTTEAFLEITDPEITLISAGKENRYGHPHKETLERLKAVESRVYSTQESGAVTVVTDGETVYVEEYIQDLECANKAASFYTRKYFAK